MISVDGIKAFHGKMKYEPRNTAYRKVLEGDFVHRQFDEGGYWYNGGSSYPDKYCEIIEDDSVSLGEIADEIRRISDALRELKVTEENRKEVFEIASIVEEVISKISVRGTSE